ncbi:MAG: MFS transporter [Alphaproteobacteria bacterium]|nr:MFS transporter [Alphaproteobacteria bacterium]
MTENTFRTAARFAVFYGALFLVLGVMLPFWPVWLKSRGLDASQIGFVLAIGPWMRVIADPLITRGVDRSGHGKRALVLFAGISIAAFSGFFFAQSFWPIVLVTLIYAPVYHVLIPLGDSQTMVAVVRDKLDYGRIRLWGSATFIAGTFGAGWLLTDHPPDVIVPTVFVGLMLVLGATLLLREQNAPARIKHFGGFLDLLRDRAFLYFVLAASAVQASHAVLNGFSVIHWREAGLSGTLIALLWAGSVVAEIILFAVSGSAVRRLGPFGLLSLGAVAGLIRWIILAETTALPGLIVAQTLHAATFGATYLATMHFIAARAPAGLKASAQGTYASVSGVVMGISMLLAGGLYGMIEESAFYAMAVVCAFAILIGLAARREVNRAG